MTVVNNEGRIDEASEETEGAEEDYLAILFSSCVEHPYRAPFRVKLLAHLDAQP